jgi:predicted RNA binding protein YcfA (HicA-like mRNA interferase family)
MKKGSHKVRLPNPHGKDISLSLVKEILRQAKIADNVWDSA